MGLHAIINYDGKFSNIKSLKTDPQLTKKSSLTDAAILALLMYIFNYIRGRQSSGLNCLQLRQRMLLQPMAAADVTPGHLFRLPVHQPQTIHLQTKTLS